MEEKKGLVQEFKEFVSRGNVMDMAVGVIIGGAFTAIVTSLVNDILMPIIGGVTGGLDFTAYAFNIGEASVNYGTFIQAIVNFLLVALCVFLLVKAVNKAKKKEEPAPAPEEPAAEPEPSEEVLLLREIRDSLKK